MDEFIKQELEDITKAAKIIISRIQGIYGFCDGMAVAVKDFEREQEEKERQKQLIESK